MDPDEVLTDVQESSSGKRKRIRSITLDSRHEIRLGNIFLGSGQQLRSRTITVGSDEFRLRSHSLLLPDDIVTSPDQSQNFSASPLPSPRRDRLSILVLGPPGVGKSTLVNSILNISEAKVKHGAAAQRHKPVELYEGQCENNDILVCDSKGLSLLASKQQIRKECRAIHDCLKSKRIVPDLVFICVKSTERFESFPDVSHLASFYGIDEFWNHTIIVLTNANILPITMEDKSDEEIIESIQQSVKDIHKHFTKAMAAQYVKCLEDLPYICVGKYSKSSSDDKQRKLVTSEDWVSDLLQLSYERCNERAKLVMKNILDAYIARFKHKFLGKIFSHKTCEPILKTMATCSDIEAEDSV